MVRDNLESNHNFKDTIILVYMHKKTKTKKKRKIAESSITFTYNSIKQRPGFFNLSHSLVWLALKSYKITYLK